MCYIGDAEQPKLFSQQIKVARKQHNCCECGSSIEPGERYEYVSGLWEDFCVFKTCLFCVEVREDYNSRAHEDERVPFEYLWDCVGYDYGVGG